MLVPFHSRAADLSDLLNYAALVDEGVVLGRDGSLMAGFFFRGDDAASATTLERNYLTVLVDQYSSRLGAGWSLWINASCLPSPGYPCPDESFFLEPVAAMIDAERRVSFVKDHVLFESECAPILTYLPPTRHDSKLSEMVYGDDGIDDADPADRLLTDFKKKLDDLQSGLGDLPHVRRMGTIEVGEDDDTYQSDELVSCLHYTLIDESTALCIPDYPMYLDTWLGYPPPWPGGMPKVGDRLVSCVAIEGFPGNSYLGVLDMLDVLSMAYRWSSWLIFLEQHEAVAALNHYRLK